MKFFIRKLSLLLLVCLLGAAVANLAFYLVKGRMTPANVERFLHVPDQIQVGNLGSSHGQNGFSYLDHPDLVTVNLAFGYQGIAQDERVLQNYIDHFAKGATLYIPVSYFTLIGEPTVRRDQLTINRRFYYFMRPRYILDFSWREWLAVKSPGLFLPSWTAVYWKTEEFDIAGQQTAESMDVEAHAELAVQSHILKNRTDDGYVLSDEWTACLTRIVTLCKEHDITPILITTPFLREYNDLVPADFLSMQQSYLTEFAAQQQIEYLDFSRDARFIDRYDLFMNSDHLNDSGALIFTDLLLGGALPQAEDTGAN